MSGGFTSHSVLAMTRISAYSPLILFLCDMDSRPSRAHLDYDICGTRGQPIHKVLESAERSDTVRLKEKEMDRRKKEVKGRDRRRSEDKEEN